LQGIDFNRCHVITCGICNDGTKIQRGGRAVRDPNNQALFLVIFENWVHEFDIREVPFEELDEDPDRPLDISGKKFPMKLERTGIFNIKLLQDVRQKDGSPAYG
jgi:hypothetical protein